MGIIIRQGKMAKTVCRGYDVLVLAGLLSAKPARRVPGEHCLLSPVS